MLASSQLLHFRVLKFPLIAMKSTWMRVTPMGMSSMDQLAKNRHPNSPAAVCRTKTPCFRSKL